MKEKEVYHTRSVRINRLLYIEMKKKLFDESKSFNFWIDEKMSEYLKENQSKSLYN